jgi:hypothetical protein
MKNTMDTTTVSLPKNLQAVRKHVIVRVKGVPPSSFFTGFSHRKIHYKIHFSTHILSSKMTVT